MCNGEAQDSKSVDMESLPEEKGIQKKAKYKIICKSFFLFFWRGGGEVVLINILHTACPHYFSLTNYPSTSWRCFYSLEIWQTLRLQ